MKVENIEKPTTKFIATKLFWVGVVGTYILAGILLNRLETNASYEEPTLEEIIKQLLSDSEQSQEEASGDDYESPDDVDYRGDFKPEMVQLLSQMRGQPEAGDEDGSENTQGISQAEIEQALRDSTEIDFDDDAEVTTVAANMMKEMGTDMPQNPAGSGYNQIPHVDEEGGPLEALEPRSFAYDEWDFRANDYRPRWCIVQERLGVSGETSFYNDTLHSYAGLVDQIKRQFESVRPEMYRKVKRLPEGEDVDIDFEWYLVFQTPYGEREHHGMLHNRTD